MSYVLWLVDSQVAEKIINIIKEEGEDIQVKALGLHASKEIEKICRLNKTEAKKPEVRIQYKEEYITKLLLQLGIPAYVKGCKYARACIEMALQNPNRCLSMTKGIYPSIAAMYDTTESGVEKAIRYAIGVSWEKGNTEVYEKIFGHSRKNYPQKPTNAEFIATIVDAIRFDLNTK